MVQLETIAQLPLQTPSPCLQRSVRLDPERMLASRREAPELLRAADLQRGVAWLDAR